MSGKYRKENNCLNCGFQVEEHYCSRCGQPNLELNENFWQFISHSVAHYFHFDNKFFQTLIPLLTKPGKVTLDYLAGKRARYINPVSMYIFVSILYFLVVYNGTTEKQSLKEGKRVERKRKEIEHLLQDSTAKPKDMAALFLYRNVDLDKSETNQTYDRFSFNNLSFDQQKRVIDQLNQHYKNSDSSKDLKKIISKFEASHILKNDSTYAAYLSRQEKLPLQQRDGWYERMLQKRSIEIGANSDKIQEILKHNRPKQYFLFMPLMALFVMINFRKNHFRYLDHLIFTIHGMTAFFMVSIIVQPLKKLFFESSNTISGLVELLLIGWILWYLFKSLKIFYQRKTGVTIGRMIWIIILYGISLKLSELIMINIIFYVST